MSSLLASTSTDQEDLLVKAMLVVLHHGQGLLSLQDIGRLSITSKAIQNTVEDCHVWKSVFQDISPDPVPLSILNAARAVTWNGEQGLLPCFTAPDSPASGLQKSNWTTPVQDVQHDSAAWTCVKTRAKEMFLLNYKDLDTLPSATVTPGTGPGGKTSTMYAYNDVKQKSFEKWGGAAGLEAEICRRVIKANQRYVQKQNSDKPMKKRPKIMHQSTRPTDDPALVVSPLLSNLPIGFVQRKSKCIRMVGNTFGHLLMEHGVLRGPGTNLEPVNHPRSLYLDLNDVVGLPTELVHCFANADFSQFRNQTGVVLAGVVDSVFRPRQNGDQLTIVCHDDFTRSFFENASTVTAYCKTGNGHTAHKELFDVAGGDASGYHATFCKENLLGELVVALGLTQTSPVQFLAGILAHMYSAKFLKCMYMEDGVDDPRNRGFEEVRLLKEAILMLKAAQNDEDDDEHEDNFCGCGWCR
ncbi:expressed unknown protein [Seminavis robusta]|uniref:Uncharacterized protein n=1 Tax=Seminavis robusta TaxID=568900 RepID=A0A9N8DUI2_9STRA|nr:expressed unknown protein [Seminavis robusta]|eukprot:Sro286_g108260.1 n/a (469) ;mRNA; f:25262-26899